MKINNYLYSFLIILFLLNPFFGVLFLINIMIFFNINKEQYYLLLIFLLSVFLSFVNMTKVPESDLYNHGWRFLNSGRYNLIPYLILNAKEPFFFIFNYIVYYLTNGSFKVWVFSFSFISYILILKSVYLYFKKINGTKNQIILGFVIASFFPLIFSLSAHLIRQFMATAIFIYFAVSKIFNNKNYWWLVIVGVFTHSSSILLFPLVYLNFLGDFKNRKLINIIFLFVLISYQFFAGLLYKILAGKFIMLSYILERAKGDTTYDLGKFPIINIVIIIIMFIITLSFEKRYLTRVSKIESDNVELLVEKKEHIRRFFALSWFLSAFIMLNINQSELSLRLFYYLIFFLPFFIPLILYKIKKIETILVLVLSNSFIIYFLYKIVYGTWTYAPLYRIFINSFLTYIINPDPKIS